LTFDPGVANVMRAHGLSVRRGHEVLFKPLDFELHAGTLMWLRGANGSGKTSLLRVAAGLASLDSGSLTWNNEPINRSDGYKAKLVYLGHTNGLKDDLSAMESLQFLTTIHHRACAPERIETALRRLGVFHRRKLPTRLLSQGQRRRVALARLALEDKPGVWILDEPFDSLDDAGLVTVQQMFRENVQRGGSVLFTSHISVASEGLPMEVLTLRGAREA
jgi:heme exporter protein A